MIAADQVVTTTTSPGVEISNLRFTYNVTMKVSFDDYQELAARAMLGDQYAAVACKALLDKAMEVLFKQPGKPK